LADHVIRKHKKTHLMAKGLRSQTRLSHTTRKAKRGNKPYVCSVSMCAKVIKRPHNYLKDTHNITDEKLYKKLSSKI